MTNERGAAPLEFRGGPLDGERYQDIVRGAIADADAAPVFYYETVSARARLNRTRVLAKHTYELEGGAYVHRGASVAEGG